MGRECRRLIFLQVLSSFHCLWFYCRFFSTSGSSELAVPLDSHSPLFLWRWNRALISLEKEFASCWWIQNTNIGFLSFSLPRLTSPSTIFREVSLEITEMVVSLLLTCDWYRLASLAWWIWVLRVWWVWLVSARGILILKVAFSLCSSWRYSDSETSAEWYLFYEFDPRKFFPLLIYIKLHFSFKSTFSNSSRISTLAINTRSGCLNQRFWSSH